jgi:hypothetical protein
MSKMAKSFRKGQLLLIGVIVIIIGIILYDAVFSSLNPETNFPVQGTPTKNPQTGLYPVNILVMGHRDWTILHTNLHANVRIDFVSYYFQEYPVLQSGRTWAGFTKTVHVTVTISGGNLSSTLINTFDNQVSLGADWGRILTYNLPSGSYMVIAQSIDKDGFSSLATTTLTLP